MNLLTGRIYLDFRSEEPLYAQMVRQIEVLVRQGILKPGDQLPTVRELAIDLRVNFSTIARVYKILDEQKLISTQRGRGTYIWDEGEHQSVTNGSDTNALKEDRSDLATRLAQKLFKEGLQLGLTQAEIMNAVNQELAREKWPKS